MNMNSDAYQLSLHKISFPATNFWLRYFELIGTKKLAFSLFLRIEYACIVLLLYFAYYEIKLN